jgi:endogenous inhibitor of DNA gyrase (YacG/DUF329 family)
MHKVVLKGKHAVSVKCSTCKASLEIQANRHSHPVTMAFVHAKQSIPATCPQCTKGFIWSPEELVPVLIIDAPVSFDAKDLMSAHFEATALEPAMAMA